MEPNGDAAMLPQDTEPGAAAAARQPEWLQAVYTYHERSKHRFSAYAKGPATLDWDAQPDPFRVYAGAPMIELPLDELSSAVSYADALAGGVEPREISLLSIAQLLRLAFGITAWKQLRDGTRWALRANPSSGNLHPTEAWLFARGVADLHDGLYHYDCREHALELRCEYPAGAVEKPQLLVALSTIYWREAWKYGERAFRYCHLDSGHAAAALGFACGALGWQAQQQIIGSDELDAWLGLNRNEHTTVEQEAAACIFQILTQHHASATANLPALANLAKAGSWHGQPNRLDPKPMYTWPALTEIAAATRAVCAPRAAAAVSIEPTEAAVARSERPAALFPAIATAANISAENLVTLRRSAQAYDPDYQLPHDHFVDMLQAFFETAWQPLLQQPARVHLIFAVHRVRDLTPGIYVLPRSDSGERLLRAQLTRWSDWTATAIAIGSHRLHRIRIANTLRAAATLCCLQPIASDCSFVAGFLAEFDSALTAPESYCALFHEAGALAQAAYLRATALGIAGTGIGCFFDDEWHELLGIENTSLQFVYHFAAGKPLFDTRLTQHPGYFHLADQLHRFERRLA